MFRSPALDIYPAPKRRPQLPMSHLQEPMPPLPPLPQMTIRKVPTSSSLQSDYKGTQESSVKNPRSIIDLNNLSTNPHITAALEPLLSQWSANLSSREVAIIGRMPVQEAEGIFVVRLIESLEAEKRRRRAAESRVKMLEETQVDIWKKRHQVIEETKELLRKRSQEMREEGEWVCMRARDLGEENSELRDKVKALEIELWNMKKCEGAVV